MTTITAKVVADSVVKNEDGELGSRITTIEVEFPRIILAEVNTHRLFSRNYSSTRAIPILSQLENISNNPALPVFYGKKQSGMVASQELDDVSKAKAEAIILDMLRYVSEGVKALDEVGLHKQHTGRYVEPWMHVKGVITSTEWENFMWLRNHPDAQPEFQMLAQAIYDALQASVPVQLSVGDWHTPYYRRGYWIDYGDGANLNGEYLEDALKISASCCAQVSYRKNDNSFEKAEQVFGRLNIGVGGDSRCHASPVEHQATPMVVTEEYNGSTAYHYDLGHMSGNMVGWQQYRQMIDGHVKW